MKKIILLLSFASLLLFGIESPKKWFPIKPYNTEKTLKNDTNNSGVIQNNPQIINNIIVLKNLLDGVKYENLSNSDQKNWYSLDSEE